MKNPCFYAIVAKIIYEYVKLKYFGLKFEKICRDEEPKLLKR